MAKTRIRRVVERRSTPSGAMISSLQNKIDWLSERLGLTSQALDIFASKELARRGVAITAESLANEMVEYMSDGLRRIEEGYVPPEGTAEAIEKRLVEVFEERHACGECERCRAREKKG